MTVVMELSVMEGYHLCQVAFSHIHGSSGLKNHIPEKEPLVIVDMCFPGKPVCSEKHAGTFSLLCLEAHHLQECSSGFITDG